MQKLLAIALLALFGLPFASSLLATLPKSEANLPACCRRDGRHHCMMSMMDSGRKAGNTPAFSSPRERCPFAPWQQPVVRRHDFAGVAPGGAIFAGLVSHPALHPQTLAMWRIHRARSNQKRGPPTA